MGSDPLLLGGERLLGLTQPNRQAVAFVHRGGISGLGLAQISAEFFPAALLQLQLSRDIGDLCLELGEHDVALIGHAR